MKKIFNKKSLAPAIGLLIVGLIAAGLIIFSFVVNNNIASKKTISATAPSFANRINDGDTSKA